MLAGKYGMLLTVKELIVPIKLTNVLTVMLLMIILGILAVPGISRGYCGVIVLIPRKFVAALKKRPDAVLAVVPLKMMLLFISTRRAALLEGWAMLFGYRRAETPVSTRKRPVV